MQEAFEAALMQSILTRPGLNLNSTGLLPFDGAQKSFGPQSANLSQRDGMLTFGALMRKRQKPFRGKLPPLHHSIESSFPEGEWMTGMKGSFDWYSGVSQVNITSAHNGCLLLFKCHCFVWHLLLWFQLSDTELKWMLWKAFLMIKENSGTALHGTNPCDNPFVLCVILYCGLSIWIVNTE